MKLITVKILDVISRVTLFGIRFYDPAFNKPVTDGLEVHVYPPGKPEKRVRGIVNNTGVYVCNNLPGLRRIEFGNGDKEYWNSIKKKVPFIIEVTDSMGYYQPVLFNALLPSKGLYKWEGKDAVPLFSAPTRPVSGNMAAIHLDLVDIAKEKEAAWAVIEISIKDWITVRGVANKSGVIALIFPYPRPEKLNVSPDSPPSSSLIPFNQQTWKLQIKAYYKRKKKKEDIPQLEDILNKPSVNLYKDPSCKELLTEGSLMFGKGFVLKSSDNTDYSPSVLYIKQI